MQVPAIPHLAELLGDPTAGRDTHEGPREVYGPGGPWKHSVRTEALVGELNFGKFCNFLAGSFSAVSKRNFARKYAFDSIFPVSYTHLTLPTKCSV